MPAGGFPRWTVAAAQHCTLHATMDRHDIRGMRWESNKCTLVCISSGIWLARLPLTAVPIWGDGDHNGSSPPPHTHTIPPPLQLEAARWLLEERRVPVNQRERAGGWTPLLRCARVAHYRHGAFLDLFELLLRHGADPSLATDPLPPDAAALGQPGARLGVLDVAAKKGFGWEAGEVRGQCWCVHAI